MGESLLITLREGFEAGLTVAIVFAFLRKAGRMDLARPVWLGIAASLALSVLSGVVFNATLGGFNGLARLRTFAVVLVLAGALLVWMVFWMREQARRVKTDVEERVAEAVATGSTFALAFVAFIAVLRDGVETALFIIASTSSVGEVGVGTLIGAVAGLALSVMFTYLVYRGSRLVPIKRFFQVSGVLMIVFAAGLVSRGVMNLQQSGDLASFNLNGVYDLTGVSWLTTGTETGRFLGALFGWDPRPSIEQVVAYLAVAVPLLVLYFRTRPSQPAAPVPVEDAVAPDARPAPTATARGGRQPAAMN
ncbi:MAG: FTR1 family protein [Actinobacteria bacterium]|nr:FTR1 family protein [Actinomycetota bacterium]